MREKVGLFYKIALLKWEMRYDEGYWLIFLSRFPHSTVMGLVYGGDSDFYLIFNWFWSFVNNAVITEPVLTAV